MTVPITEDQSVREAVQRMIEMGVQSPEQKAGPVQTYRRLWSLKPMKVKRVKGSLWASTSVGW